VALVRTDVLKELIVSMIRVERIDEQCQQELATEAHCKEIPYYY
jgi:hypothetical protein